MHWKTHNSPRPKKNTCLGCRSRKCVCVSPITRVHYGFIAQGQTVNQQCYLEVLTRLRESDRRKRPELWSDKWILHHDNALGHDTLRIREFLAKNSITKMDHPPYTPDLVPCDFCLFPKLKMTLRDKYLLTFLTSKAT